MKKKIFFIPIFLLCCTIAFAQTKIDQKIDSLIANAAYPQALALIDQQNSTPLLLNKKAEVLMAQGKLADAEKILSLAISSNAFEKAITESNYGFLQLLKGRSDLAMEKLQTAREDFKTSDRINSKENARCLSNLSLLYWSDGKFNRRRKTVWHRCNCGNPSLAMKAKKPPRR